MSLHFLKHRAELIASLSIEKVALSWLLAACIAGSLALPARAQQSNDDPAATQPPRGVAISYDLPATGPLPQTYRVTLAITDVKNPDWVIDTFAAGVVRTVTAENGGHFTETWDGLDDNFMPAPPGPYGVKGIFMPARVWGITGEYHTFIPKFLLGAGDSWMPDRQNERKPLLLWGAGFGTMSDIATRPDGTAVFYYKYAEGSGNPMVVDLRRPVGYDQVIKAYSPSGVAGGEAIATDGEAIWGLSTGAREANFIYRVEAGGMANTSFGDARSRYRSNVFFPPGHVTSLAAWRNPATGQRFLYISETGAAEDILVLDGDHATDLARLPIKSVRSISVRDGYLYALHPDDAGTWWISRTRIAHGIPQPAWITVVALHGIADPMDFKIDAHGTAYVSDLHANQVYALDPAGEVIRRFGRAADQTPGHYDHEIFMSPGKLAIWTDPKGHDKLLVTERSGPGRVSEWTTDGKLLREWFPGQPHAIFGFAVDPEDPEHLYMATSEPASGSGLIRFKVDYDTATWRVDAVWPGISAFAGFPGGATYPKIINHGGHKYLAFARENGLSDRHGYMIYRQDGDNWVPSAGLFAKPGATPSTASLNRYWWHDAHGDGHLHEDEFSKGSAQLPTHLRYWGEQWLDDLSLMVIADDGHDVWRIAPMSFDAAGNPSFEGSTWKKLLTDMAFATKAAGTADATHGANEVSASFDNPWTMVNGSTSDGFYVNSYTGPRIVSGIDSTGQIGAQVKITRYAPDENGSFAARWRVGRKAFGLAKPGEMYGTLHITPPINHLLTVQDGNGLFHVFTDDGLYVDTLLQDDARFKPAEGGVYSLNFELFNGYAFLNKATGKVYLAAGRIAANLFEVDGWTADKNNVTRLTSLPQTVSLSAEQTAPAPDFALQARGGAGTAKVARFGPSGGGGPAIDGSMIGWETADAVRFGLDASHDVEVRTFYDPEDLYLRWHVRLPYKFEPKEAPALGRIFTDSQAADTLSFYIQGDPHAPPTSRDTRPGDTRLVFAIVKKDGRSAPVALALYPKWPGPGPAHPASYISPVGSSRFENATPLTAARLGYSIDADQKGFVIAAAIPRSAIPLLPQLSGDKRTTVNFEATLAGKTKFWWANTDKSASTLTSDEPSEAEFYPGSWAQAQFTPLADSLPVGAWLVSGPWGGDDLRSTRIDDKVGLMKFFDAAKYPPDLGPADFQAKYTGPLATDIRGTAHSISWTVAQTEHGNPLVLTKNYGQLYFAATWIFVPRDQDIECEFFTEQHNITSVQVNDMPVTSRTLGNPPLTFRVPTERETVHFHKGWNRVFARAYAVGYDLKLGMSMHADSETLWSLRLSPSPP